MESVKFATSGQKYGRKRSVRSLISFWFFGYDFRNELQNPKIIVFGHQEHLNGSFCVVFIFHASLIWSVRYSNKTAKNDKSGMVTLLFEGSAYNTSRYFAHCSCFSSTLWGSRKYCATCKMFPPIIVLYIGTSNSLLIQFCLDYFRWDSRNLGASLYHEKPNWTLYFCCQEIRRKKCFHSRAFLANRQKFKRVEIYEFVIWNHKFVYRR